MTADFTRVRDNTINREFSVRHVKPHHEVLDERAVDVNGRVLARYARHQKDVRRQEGVGKEGRRRARREP